jgi:hypothetical protein
VRQSVITTAPASSPSAPLPAFFSAAISWVSTRHCSLFLEPSHSARSEARRTLHAASSGHIQGRARSGNAQSYNCSSATESSGARRTGPLRDAQPGLLRAGTWWVRLLRGSFSERVKRAPHNPRQAGRRVVLGLSQTSWTWVALVVGIVLDL